jgi:hypothetical protein
MQSLAALCLSLLLARNDVTDHFFPGVSVGVFGKSDNLKPAGSVDLTLAVLNLWISGGARFNADMISPYAEGGAYLFLNVGGGVSWVPKDGPRGHFFLGAPIPIIMKGSFPLFIEPYMRMTSGYFREYGLLVKTNLGGREIVSSCPHVYSFDGNENRIDGDMLSGAFSRNAETDDLDRMEHLVASQGQYRIRIANERRERDYINQVSLLAVEHAAEETVLPSSRGTLVRLGPLVGPLAASDNQGHDERAAVVAEDGRNWRGHPLAHDPDKESKPEDTLEITLPLPEGEGSPYLVLRVRNTDEATDSLYQYLGRMGPGILTLLDREARDNPSGIKQKMDKELERLGIPLHVSVATAQGWKPVESLRPVGPAAPRYQIVPLPTAGLTSGQTVKVRLAGTPGGWEIDRVAVANGSPVVATALALAKVGGLPWTDLAGILAKVDDRRVLLHNGEAVDLAFTAPPPTEGKSRSLFLRLHGYYEVEMSRGIWLNPVALYRDRTGADSAPRFFLRSLRRN